MKTGLCTADCQVPEGEAKMVLELVRLPRDQTRLLRDWSMAGEPGKHSEQTVLREKVCSDHTI